MMQSFFLGLLLSSSALSAAASSNDNPSLVRGLRTTGRRLVMDGVGFPLEDSLEDPSPTEISPNSDLESVVAYADHITIRAGWPLSPSFAQVNFTQDPVRSTGFNFGGLRLELETNPYIPETDWFTFWPTDPATTWESLLERGFNPVNRSTAYYTNFGISELTANSTNIQVSNFDYTPYGPNSTSPTAAKNAAGIQNVISVEIGVTDAFRSELEKLVAPIQVDANDQIVFGEGPSVKLAQAPDLTTYGFTVKVVDRDEAMDALKSAGLSKIDTYRVAVGTLYMEVSED